MNIIAWQAGRRTAFRRRRLWRNWILPGQCKTDFFENGGFVDYKLLIDGQWVGSGSPLEVKNKYNGSTVGVLPTASREDLDRALDAAERAEDVMADMPAYKRADI